MMDMLRAVGKKLEGVKTYIGVIAGALLGIAVSFGWVTEPGTIELWASLIAGFTGVAVASKANRVVKALAK